MTSAPDTTDLRTRRRELDTIAVIIPTFRRGDLLARLVDSLFAGDRPPDEVIIVDNDPEESAILDQGRWPVRILRAGHGLNLAAARNDGWRNTTADLCVFIDDDNEIESGALGPLASACTDPGVGLAGPVIFAGDEGTIWCGGITRSKWTGVTRCMFYGKTDPPCETSWATAGMPDAFAVPRVVLEAVNGFDDERFPFSYDEADFNERIGRLGLESIVVRDSVVKHYGFVVEDPGKALVRATMIHGPLRARAMTRSRARFHRQHSHGLQRLTTLSVFVPLWAMWTVSSCLRAEAAMWVRLRSVWAIVAGLYEGYMS
jgi:glycosyltransferase involved in cell wall biosynthesis